MFVIQTNAENDMKVLPSWRGLKGSGERGTMRHTRLCRNGLSSGVVVFCFFFGIASSWKKTQLKEVSHIYLIFFFFFLVSIVAEGRWREGKYSWRQTQNAEGETFNNNFTDQSRSAQSYPTKRQTIHKTHPTFVFFSFFFSDIHSSWAKSQRHSKGGVRRMGKSDISISCARQLNWIDAAAFSGSIKKIF